jgi:hypothetical protein
LGFPGGEKGAEAELPEQAEISVRKAISMRKTTRSHHIMKWTRPIMHISNWRIADLAASEVEREMLGREITSMIHEELQAKKRKKAWANTPWY